MREKKIRDKKIIYLIAAFILYIGIVIVRLVFLQVYQNDFFARLGEQNFLRTEILPSTRGNVLDCNGRMLATNRPVFDVYWHGSGHFRLQDRQKDFVDILRRVLGEDVLDTFMLKKIERAERFSRQVLLKKDLRQDELSKISEQCGESQNIFIKRHLARIYPHRSLACHMLGYLRRVQEGTFEGLYGVERKFQDDLKGESGYVKHVINSFGKKVVQKDVCKSVDGGDVKLTLDLTLQRIAESLFEPGQSGAFILLDPEDGAIKAMLSYPNFDPNLFLAPITEETWDKKFCVDSPLLNRAIHASYPPASIFKLITFVVGLEEGVITTDTEFECKGHRVFCGRKYHCHRRWGHGSLSAVKALGVSCNIPCYEIAEKISIDQLAAYAMRFGLGQSTNFVFPDKKGLIPTTGWKQAYKGERWWKGETLSACIGQSFLLVTPLQIARMVSGICSGSLVRPRILCDEEVIRHPLYISQETLAFLREVMREVVTRGTARMLKKFTDFSIWAKTGTAQTVSLQRQRKESKKQLEHAWFASFFSYKEQKPLAMVVLVENVGSSRPALRIVEKFFTIYKEVLTYG